MERTIFTLTVTTLGLLLGIFEDAQMLFYALIAAMIIDFITGVVKGFTNGRADSKVATKGISRKVGTWAIIAATCIIDMILNQGAILTKTTTMFYIATELLSIIENVGEIVEIPAVVRNAISRLKDKEGEDDREISEDGTGER